MPGTKKTATGVLGGLAGLVGLSAVAGVLVTATVTPAIAVSGAAASSAITMFDNMPSYLEIDELMLPTEIYATASDGTEVQLARFYDQNRLPVTYEQINPVVYDAILSSEDPRYYDHGGVDLIGTSRAVISNVQGGATQGGSSISQQYVKNVLVQRCERDAPTAEDLQACWVEATTASGMDGIERKLQEMRYAIAMEQRYSKNEILLGYLNIANFGGTNYGVEAAAQYYFGTSAANLSLGQAATLAGMVQNPNTFRIDRPESESNGAANGYQLTLDRRNYVLGRMLADGKISQEQYDAAYAEPIAPNIVPSTQGCESAGGSAFFCDYVRTIVETDEAFGETPEERQAALRRGGLKIYTTIDLDLQKAAEDAISIVPATHPNLDLGSSGVQLEVSTGRVLSMVQNRPYTQDADKAASDPAFTSVNFNTPYINGGSNGFLPGSTYKVFTLLNWLEHGHSVNEVLNGRQRNFTVMADCDGGTQRITSNQIKNFQGVGGYNGTPMRFTADSLNTGFLAMSEKVSVCDTNKIAERMGVELANGGSVTETNFVYDILGSKAIAPIDMAAAYATIANKGIYCEPKAIDRVIDADGNELPLPETTCNRVLDESVAATAAFTLEGVINGGSAGSSRTYDGVPVFGKTGIHEQIHTWMDGASSKVATVVWVGNVKGEVRLDRNSANGRALWTIRHSIWPVMQRAANAKYGGDDFPRPDQNLTRQVFIDLPSVVGQSVDQARATLQAAGFSVNVGDAVDASESAGTIVRQDPGAGRVSGATVVTIYPSNGEGASIPGGLVGQTQEAAASSLRSAGFGNVSAQCTENEDAPENGRVTGVSPDEGTSTNRNTAVTLSVERRDC
ncbi:transglycosylase domain-containing protein [Microbacterium limosum]|uniref:Transglycosylase domain-containing protein n=1 Tax=Microbacterium limosum TaxID=3079935 RepID=A0AAU0MJT1_9MICO|nr:transglycosylase domain-containing protein [Microbacterium sp. Y20]WOQ70242.1 transglycosylase domain-containing protein [Microbacterium sp. Y20]